MLFALKGISETSMDDVCLAAGCSKGGLYHHFRGKGEIIAALIRRLEAGNALLPPFEASEDEGLPGAGGVGRVLIELWSAAAKDSARAAGLRDQLSAAYGARNGADHDAPGDVLAQLLQMGALVEQVTREAITDPAEAARRLGIGRAA